MKWNKPGGKQGMCPRHTVKEAKHCGMAKEPSNKHVYHRNGMQRMNSRNGTGLAMMGYQQMNLLVSFSSK